MVNLVRAAGGVVVREGSEGPEVALVHRPAYDDWSFPKGKLEAGEEEPEAAVREVGEETGLHPVIVEDLGAISYVDGRGRPKVVRYWLMRPTAGDVLRGDHEIDEARWFPIDDAKGLLTYPHDRALLTRAVGRTGAGVTVPIYVMRHAKAGERASWGEPDELRPLSKTGRKQAVAIATTFAGVGLTGLLTSPTLRCTQSLEPLADGLGLEIMVAPELEEGRGPGGIEAWVHALAADGPAMLCTHGDVVHALIDSVLDDGAAVGGDGTVAFRKASTWRLDVRDGLVRVVTYLAPPSRPRSTSTTG